MNYRTPRVSQMIIDRRIPTRSCLRVRLAAKTNRFDVPQLARICRAPKNDAPLINGRAALTSALTKSTSRALRYHRRVYRYLAFNTTTPSSLGHVRSANYWIFSRILNKTVIHEVCAEKSLQSAADCIWVTRKFVERHTLFTVTASDRKALELNRVISKLLYILYVLILYDLCTLIALPCWKRLTLRIEFPARLDRSSQSRNFVKTIATRGSCPPQSARIKACAHIRGIISCKTDTRRDLWYDKYFGIILGIEYSQRSGNNWNWLSTPRLAFATKHLPRKRNLEFHVSTISIVDWDPRSAMYSCQ